MSRSRTHPVATILLSMALFFVLDGILFRSGLYARFQKPNTPAGSMMAIIRFTHAAPADPDQTVLVMGNSKTEYGFGVRNVEQDFPGSPMRMVLGAFPASNEEYWYYALGRIDPQHNRYAAIVIPLPGYKITPYDEGFGDSYTAAQMLLPIVPTSGLHDFLADFNDPSLRWRAALLAIAPSHLYASDLQDFLLHPSARLSAVRAREAVGVNFLYFDVAHTDTMDELKVDPKSHKVLTYPTRFNALFRDAMDEKFVEVPADEAKQRTARNAAFSAKWLAKIEDLYIGSRTKLVFVNMPHEPVELPARQPIAGAPDIRDLLPPRSNVVFLPQGLFEDLEQAHWFTDLDHLDVYGKEQFSRRLGQAVIDILEQRSPESSAVRRQ